MEKEKKTGFRDHHEMAHTHTQGGIHTNRRTNLFLVAIVRTRPRDASRIGPTIRELLSKRIERRNLRECQKEKEESRFL